MATISFVIPIHNEQDSIGLCVSSLKKLKLPQKINIEIIAVLDRCSDDSENILKKFSGIKIIKKDFAKWNYKYSETVNFGMEHGKGDFLVILDADTVLADDWLIQILKTFEKKDVVSASGQLRILPINIINKFLRENVTPLGCNRIYIAEIWRKYKGFRDMFAPDTELDIRLMARGYEIILNSKAKAFDIRKYTLKKIWRNAIEKGMAKYQLHQSIKFVFASGFYSLITNPFGILDLLGNLLGMIKGKIRKLRRYEYQNLMKTYVFRRLQKKY